LKTRGKEKNKSRGSEMSGLLGVDISIQTPRQVYDQRKQFQSNIQIVHELFKSSYRKRFGDQKLK